MSTGNASPSPVTDPGEACPYCETTTGVQVVADASPKVHAWSCTACGTEWVITVVNRRRATMVEQLDAASLLRHVITLADDAPTITNEQLLHRLLELADRSR
jgi:hypothetical protein